MTEPTTPDESLVPASESAALEAAEAAEAAEAERGRLLDGPASNVGGASDEVPTVTSADPSASDRAVAWTAADVAAAGPDHWHAPADPEGRRYSEVATNGTAAPADEPTPSSALDEPAAAEVTIDVGDADASPAPAVSDPGSPAATDTPDPAATPAPAAVPSPALLARRLHAAPPSSSVAFGRVADDGTVFVRTPDGEREVGSYPGASPAEALAYFARKYDEVDGQLDLLLHRVTQTDLAVKEASEALGRLRATVRNLKAVGDMVALSAKLENVATAVEARRAVENEERAHAREEARAKREEIVAEAEGIAGQPPERVQWKTSSTRMREILEEWKAAQRQGPRLDRESEQALWHRLSSARNSFDKMRRVHFAQLGSAQAQAKSAKEDLVAEAEALAKSNDWGVTAGEFKRLMDRWRQAGRASRGDDDALWQRFKAAQDSFFAAKDAVVAAETEEFRANLAVKEELLTQAQALLPITNLEAAKSALRTIQDKWDAAGKVPRADMDRIEKGMRRVESAVREAEDRRWVSTNPEVAARAQSLVTQLEAAVEGLRRDLAKAQASGDVKKVAAAQEALAAREAWLKQARTGLAEFRG